MSTKPKYKTDGRFVETHDGQDVCKATSITTARKIARALNAMEAKPKDKL
jgi:hypothetical protein